MDDIKGVSTIIHKGVVAAYDVGFGSDFGEESKSFDLSSCCANRL
jgi:hypothetical protein